MVWSPPLPSPPAAVYNITTIYPPHEIILFLSNITCLYLPSWPRYFLCVSLSLIFLLLFQINFPNVIKQLLRYTRHISLCFGCNLLLSTYKRICLVSVRIHIWMELENYPNIIHDINEKKHTHIYINILVQEPNYKSRVILTLFSNILI